MSLSFFVAGEPSTQGGMKPVPNKKTGRTVLISTGGKDLAKWRRNVTKIALQAVDLNGWEKVVGEPVAVVYRFLLPMPKSRPAAVRGPGIAYSWKQPDLDKLTRAIGDSMKVAGVYVDDAQIAQSQVLKCEVLDQSLVGVEVVVARLDLHDVALDRLLGRRQNAVRFH